MADRLRPLWDFDDLGASEARLREQLEVEETDAGRAEVLTQLARVEALRSDFDVERGRTLRSSGNAEESVPLFESAFAHACESGDYFLAGDAAHMVAIAEAGKMLEWTERGLELAETEPDAAYWAGPLLNNLGWFHYEAGEYEAALDAFQRALEARERDPENQQAIGWAKEAVAEAQRKLET